MTKQLILFRHGKSDWDADFEGDHQRPVAKRGIKAAKKMGELMAATDQIPDQVITSSAMRAKTTAELAIAAGSWQRDLQVTDALYEADPDQVLQLIQQASDTVTRLMLVGHEPTWSTLASLLIGGGQVCVPTAAMVRIDFDVDLWSQSLYGQGQLVWLLPPKLFVV
ncbi:MAG: SixA phosphatase family protein [Almyronema sp.]